MSDERRSDLLAEIVPSLRQDEVKLAEALNLLGRIYNKRAGRMLSDDCMTVEWIDNEIAAFIRAYGPLPERGIRA